jgi:hypothetical protein
MKKTILLFSAAFGLNVAIAQSTDNDATMGGQTPGINTNTPNRKTPSTHTVTPGSRNSNESSNSSSTNQSGTKNHKGKTTLTEQKNQTVQIHRMLTVLQVLRVHQKNSKII